MGVNKTMKEKIINKLETYEPEDSKEHFVKMKCPKCKRRKFDKKDEEYLKHTGRCFICDIKIHREDERRKSKTSFKSATNLAQHNHNY